MRALPFHRSAFLVRSAVRKPNSERLHAQIHSEPPSVPVYSYHCARPVERAKALPSTSHGQEICALKYALSQAIHVTARNI